MKTSLKVMLLDDELHALENLSDAIRSIDSSIEICAQFTDPLEAIRFAQKNPLDIFFVDISMPLLDGFAVLQKIGDFLPFKTVFVTAYSEYALKAIKHHVFDYLLKPIDISQLETCLENCRSVRKDQKLILQSLDKVFFVDSREILYLQADNSYTKFVLKDKSVLTSKSISHFSRLLDPAQFFRCHNSYLINRSYVEGYHKKHKSLFLTNTDEIPVSRSKKDELFVWLSQYAAIV